jgi:hypothetical protein
MSATSSFFSTFASAVSTFLAFAAEVALLVIALAYVRPRRPDAAAAFAVGAGILLVPTVVWPIVTSLVMPSVMSSVGSSGVSSVYAALSLLFALVRTAGWAAILFGVVKLASPPGGAPRDPTRFG